MPPARLPYTIALSCVRSGYTTDGTSWLRQTTPMSRSRSTQSALPRHARRSQCASLQSTRLLLIVLSHDSTVEPF